MINGNGDGLVSNYEGNFMTGDSIPKKKYYVTMTDKFMSGWGRAEGMKNKLVIGCDTYERANFIMLCALRRSEMKYVNLTSSKPKYGRNAYVSYKDEKEIRWTMN